jgi:hypothetical protein
MKKKDAPDWDHIDNKYEFFVYLIKHHLKELILVMLTLAFMISMFINLGYDKEKGGWYWKPAEISINKKVEK